MGQLFVEVENYPDLKASENFVHLQSSLNEIEEQISAARRAYNAVVTTFNNAAEMFPSNLVARFFVSIEKKCSKSPMSNGNRRTSKACSNHRLFGVYTRIPARRTGTKSTRLARENRHDTRSTVRGRNPKIRSGNPQTRAGKIREVPDPSGVFLRDHWPLDHSGGRRADLPVRRQVCMRDRMDFAFPPCLSGRDHGVHDSFYDFQPRLHPSL